MDDNTLNKAKENIEKAKETINKVNNLIGVPYNTTIYDITKTLEAIYNALSKYYEKIQTKEIPNEIYKEYVKYLREDIEKRLKELENKYITLELTGKDENGNIIKKKVHINAKLFIDLVTEKFGLALWEHLAIRMPPPELFIMILQHLEYLYDRMAKLETSVRYLTEFLVTITDAINAFHTSLKKLYEITNMLDEKISKVNEILENINKKKEELSKKL